jgi:hypothetical protein
MREGDVWALWHWRRPRRMAGGIRLWLVGKSLAKDSGGMM